jgi:AcrR family transcriptional regulator
VDAVYRLLESAELTDLTAERVADAAGISRRTFFNYFPSVEAVVAYSAEDFVHRLRAALGDRPTGESLVDSAKYAVSELITQDVFEQAVRAWRAIDASPAAKRYSLEANEHQFAEFVQDWAVPRIGAFGGHPDPLQISVLMASLLGAFDAARDYWLQRHHGSLDEQARADFIATVHRAFEVTRPMIDRT